MIDDISFSLERYGLSDFLFYKVSSDNLDLESLNKIKSRWSQFLIPIQLISKKDEAYLRYDLVSESNIVSVIDKMLDKNTLVWILSSLIECIDKIEELGLNIENIVLNKNYIFIDQITKKLMMIYIPIKGESFTKVKFVRFIKDIILNCEYSEEDDAKLFIKVFNFLVKNSDSTLTEFKEFYKALVEGLDMRQDDIGIEKSESIDNDGSIINCQYSTKKSNNKIEIEEEVQYKRVTRTEFDDKNVIDDKASYIKPASINIIPNSDNEISIVIDRGVENGTVCLDQYDDVENGTVALDECIMPSKAYLYIMNKNEKVYIDKQNFKIGRDASSVDLPILNKAIGREHGEIVFQNSQYYFIDNNSTNGSYINGNKLNPKVEYEIKHKDIIKLANEQIMFKAY